MRDTGGGKLTESRLAEGVRALAAADDALAGIVERFGHPPMWGRPAGFSTLARIILEQQVSLASAATLFERVARELGGDLTPAAVLAAGREGLQALGLTRQKAAYVHELALRVDDGRLPLGRLGRMSDDEAGARLLALPGVGPWTAGIYLLMALKRPDVWPPGDLALHRSMAPLRPDGRTPTAVEASLHAERWRPWRSVAARILWHRYLEERARAAGAKREAAGSSPEARIRSAASRPTTESASRNSASIS